MNGLQRLAVLREYYAERVATLALTGTLDAYYVEEFRRADADYRDTRATFMDLCGTS